MESKTGQFSAAISRIGGSGDRSALGRGTAAGGAVGTCGSGGRARRRRAAESGHASSWSCRGSREGPHVQPGRRGDASEGRAIERIAAGSGATVCVGAAPAANETKSTRGASTGSGALSAVRAAKRKTENGMKGMGWRGCATGAIVARPALFSTRIHRTPLSWKRQMSPMTGARSAAIESWDDTSAGGRAFDIVIAHRPMSGLAVADRVPRFGAPISSQASAGERRVVHKRAAARRRAKGCDDSREHFRADASNRGGCGRSVRSNAHDAREHSGQDES
jgi:hypothetical protein